MFLSDEKIKVNTTLNDLDIAKFAKSFRLDETKLELEYQPNLNYFSKTPSWFVSKKIENDYYFETDKMKDSKEYFFYLPKVNDKNIFFPHEDVNGLDDSFDFSGVSFSFGYRPKSTGFKIRLLSHLNGSAALFLDRDGVLNVDNGYVGDPLDLIILDDLSDIIKRCNKKGIKVIVLTNQSGVGRGYFSLDAVNKVNNKISKAYEDKGAVIDKFYICPFHKEAKPPFQRSSILRKPFPGMAAQAAQDFKIDFNRALMVGDKASDSLCFVDFDSIILKSGYHQIESSVKRNELKNILCEWVKEI